MTTASRHIEIDIPDQRLRLLDEAGDPLMDVPVSTARNGVGEVYGSEQTPRGRHVICAKIGAGQPINTVFVARRPTGEIYTHGMRQLHPDRDWILTRILWLKGLERGKNRMGNVDTMRRYIYIHGMPDEDPIGVPGSRGCIRVRNADLVRLFDLVSPGTPVEIFG
jgi:L,D-transpeptidase YbiS